MERKSVNLDLRSVKASGSTATFHGYASTYDVDEYGDQFVPGAWKDTIRAAGSTLPLLWQHDSDSPIGTVPVLAEDDHGLRVTGKIALDVQRGREAYALMKGKAVKSLSVGFTIEPGGAVTEGGVRRIRKARLWEISLATFPANAHAAITEVRARARGEDPTLARFGAIVRDLERRYGEVQASRGVDVDLVDYERRRR
jgi:uncharacterized protein